MRSATRLGGRPSSTMMSSEARISANATGTRSRMSTKKTAKRVAINAQIHQ